MKTDAISSARRTGRHIVFFGILGLATVPVAIALARGMPVWVYLAASAAFVLLSLMAVRKPGRVARFCLATALMGCVMLITGALTGHPWQVDSHMLYFAALAGLVLLVDVQVILLGVVLVAAQHVSLSVALPALIYPPADLWTNLARAAVHGVILIGEAAALVYAVWLRQAHTARAEADQARIEESLQAAQEAQRATEEAQAAQQSVVTALRENLARLAERDLSARIDNTAPGAYQKLFSDYNAAVDELSRTIASVAARAVELADGAREITQASDDLSRRTETQAATLEQTAAALEEITSSVKTSADGAGEVSSFVSETRDKARVSGELVTSTVSAMSGIEKSSEKIAQIIAVIDDIAFQTNLLSLNAGVEAARAGEAGKGFAVVATEVRALAQRSSSAAADIRVLITDSTEQIDGGVEMVKRVGSALMEIVERVDRISGFVEQIARSTAEQAEGLAEINTGVSNLDSVTQQNAAMVEQSTAAAHTFGAHASDLRASMQRFKLADAADDAPWQSETLTDEDAPYPSPDLRRAAG